MRSFAWQKCSSKQLHDYADHVNEILACLDVPVDSLVCNDILCTNSDHFDALQTYGSTIIHSCLSAAHSCIPYAGVDNMKRTAGWQLKSNVLKTKPYSGTIYGMKWIELALVLLRRSGNSCCIPQGHQICYKGGRRIC